MGIVTKPANSPGGIERDSADFERLRHARDRNEGFPIGRYLQPAPMLFTRDGHNVFLGDMYRGQTAFLVCAGPSLDSHDLVRLNDRGVLTMSVNNAATVVRTSLWCSVDDPGNFADAIWRDPGILKFVPLCHMEKPILIRDEQENLVPSNLVVGDMPGVFGFRRNENFNPRQWLFEDTFNWGNHGKRVDERGNKGSRSVMLVAVRLLFFLGVRRVYLLGCDFRMKLGAQNYAFEQDRARGSIRGNNNTYRILNDRFEMLQENFQREGFEVFNCTPNSGLSVFPHVPFEEAIEQATAIIPKQVNTAGMYDRRRREKEAKQAHREAAADQAARSAEPVLPSIAGHRHVVASADALERIINDTSVLIFANGDDIPLLGATFDSWTRTHPELTARSPLIIRHSQGHSFSSEEQRDSMPHFSVIESGAANRGSLQSLAEAITSHVDKPWFLFVGSTVESFAEGGLLTPEWVTTNENAGGLAVAGNRIDRVRPGSVLSALDEWAHRVPALDRQPPLSTAAVNNQPYVAFCGLDSSYLFGNSDWVRHVCSFVDAEVPTNDAGLYLSYCAQRLKRPLVRIRIETLGLRVRRRRLPHATML